MMKSVIVEVILSGLCPAGDAQGWPMRAIRVFFGMRGVKLQGIPCKGGGQAVVGGSTEEMARRISLEARIRAKAAREAGLAGKQACR